MFFDYKWGKISPETDWYQLQLWKWKVVDLLAFFLGIVVVIHCLSYKLLQMVSVDGMKKDEKYFPQFNTQLFQNLSVREVHF